MAMTADGKIASANRAVTSFGSARDLEHLYELRATADAVMCGARTVETAETTLSPGAAKFRQQRLRRGLAEYPVRVLVSGSGSLDADAAIFKARISPIIILTTARIAQVNLKRLQAIAEEVKICGHRELDFHAALLWLRGKWGVTRLLCEGGGELNEALFRANLVDEVHLTICPQIFGGRTAPTLADGRGAAGLGAAATFELTSTRRTKAELFTVFSK